MPGAWGRGFGALGAAGASAGLAGWLARGGGSASRSEPGSPVYRLEVEVRRERAGLGGHCTRDRAAFALPELERLPQSAGAAAIHCKNLTGGGGHPPVPRISTLWGGPSLRSVLRRAGVTESEANVGEASSSQLELFGDDGLDTGSRAGRPPVRLSMHRAAEGDVLLALRMDGEPLSAEKGAPVRLVVPGSASQSVKWLRKIVVMVTSEA